jgi:hypothetical protein
MKCGYRRKNGFNNGKDLRAGPGGARLSVCSGKWSGSGVAFAKYVSLYFSALASPPRRPNSAWPLSFRGLYPSRFLHGIGPNWRRRIISRPASRTPIDDRSRAVALGPTKFYQAAGLGQVGRGAARPVTVTSAVTVFVALCYRVCRFRTSS